VKNSNILLFSKFSFLVKSACYRLMDVPCGPQEEKFAQHWLISLSRRKTVPLTMYSTVWRLDQCMVT